ncbi:hypothetical protein CKM354_000003600 [Cercospora kikuchii]|uniref:Uncharacterized protein n=1 Tax=Cercospora kikuchii TaxID=84275 RepID=A0A9P3CAH0_9PEZI|nr:uncharacterized protein CKM354_000003600 [Cercospora kikuchii]GIZ36565.1 hypothetical protein CKM354_000003600 [Cercospora kikuchii]
MANFHHHTTHQANQAPQVAPAHRISEQRPYQAPDFDYAQWKVLREQFGASHMVPQHARVVSKVPSMEMPEVRRLRPHRVEVVVDVPASPMWVEDTQGDVDVTTEPLLWISHTAQWDEEREWYVDGSGSEVGSEALEGEMEEGSVVEVGMEGEGEEDVRGSSPVLPDGKRKRESSAGVQWVEDTHWDAPAFKRWCSVQRTIDLTGNKERAEIIDLTGED